MVAELANGRLHLHPRPALRHSSATFSMAGQLEGPFRRGTGGPGGWHFGTLPELHLGPDVLVPDLAGWRRERMPTLPAEAFFSLAPDWICEVLSPSTERIDRGRKLRIYAEAGVAHAWLLDPIQGTLEVLRLRDAAWVITGVRIGDDPVRVEPFDAVELELGLLWPERTEGP
jgi:Uma2 family endonuclease